MPEVKRMTMEDLSSEENLKELTDESKSGKVALSVLLEEKSPSTKEEKEEGMDAYNRLLKHFDIRVSSNPYLGTAAHSLSRFYKSNQPQSILLYPEFLNRVARQTLIAEPILQAIVATITPIEGNTYRSFRVEDAEDNVDSIRMKRVAEHAELPVVKITGNEESVELVKYGCMIDFTYEVARRIKIDLMKIHLQRILRQSALDEALEAIYVLINGDGNNNAAPVDLTSVLDTGGTGLTFNALMYWLLLYYPYQCNVVIGNVPTLVKLLTMTMPGVSPIAIWAMLNASAQTGDGIFPTISAPQGLYNPIKVYVHNGMPDDYLLGVDPRYGVEKLIEKGSELVETDKIIQSQFNNIAISEVVGYTKIDPNAARVLWINDEE